MSATETIIELPSFTHVRVGVVSLTTVGPLQIARIGMRVRISLVKGWGGLG